MNTILLIIALVVFITYIGSMYLLYDFLPSISDSYYKLPNKWLFPTFISTLAIIFWVVTLTSLMFFACAFLLFVGLAPAFKEDMTDKVHSIGAIGGIALGFASMWVDFGLWYLPWAMVMFSLFAVLIWKIKNHTWWIEIAAFLLIILGLFIVKY